MPELTLAETRTAEPLVRSAVLQFALSGIAALVLLGFAGVYLLRHTGESEAIRNAKQVGALTGRDIVQPNITLGLFRRSPQAIARLDHAVHGVLGRRVVRIKLWTADGRILYSDEHRLIGSRYQLKADDRATLTTGDVEAEISDLSRPENRFERRFNKLLEVYLRVRAPGGRPLIFEEYERYSSIAASGKRLWLAFLPAILGTLALLWLIQLPLAWRAARRLREGQAQRETLLQRAIEASELERRRIARDLHDGAVQNLAGVSYSLNAGADRLASSSRDDTAGVMRQAAEDTRRAIKELRTLLVDIYPPDLHRSGLEAALQDLVAPMKPRGIEARLKVESPLELSPATETLLFRCAQEALRNVARHSGASQVDVDVNRDNGVVRLVVADNGRGFDGDGEEGHLGLRLLADLAHEAGGELKLRSSPGEGTRVCVEAPA